MHKEEELKAVSKGSDRSNLGSNDLSYVESKELKVFRGSSVNTDIVLVKIEKGVIEKLELLKGSRKASNSQRLITKLLSA
ncbi:hypothetical protein H5410_055718 [Solanum commersonii]|uniref:Uncharacterized protein n=1 Tax=Solanum commersonii TaxID=4109 RepID=A0A9J5WKM8_SOLCO|nr:hypothetical protein H5410_055718 [Solanum commersonii]